MLSRLEISGLGPHKRSLIALDPTGVTTISGPSEVGKTTVLESILFALLGRSTAGRFRTEQIHDTSERAEVRMTLQDGRIIKRTATRSRSISRMISTNGQRASFSSEARFAEALGTITADPEAAHVILAPLAWVDLIGANGRPFRDLLSRAMPDSDPAQEVERIMVENGLTVSTSERAWTEKAASQARRTARQRRDELTGALVALQDQLKQQQALLADITVPDTKQAEAILHAEKTWATWDDACRMADAQADRQRQRAALGEAPALPESVSSARTAEADAETFLNEIVEAWRQARRQRDRLAEQLDGFDTDNPDICPSCQRPGWDEGEIQVITLRARLTAAEAALASATTDGEQARARQTQARERVRAAQEAQARLSAWQKAMQALSTPTTSDASPTQHAPSTPRPDKDALHNAQATLHRAQQARIAAAQRAADIQRLTKQHDERAARLDAAKTEVARLEALLDAIRVAPSRIAERQAAALGDLGPVSITFAEKPAVTVQIDGRPWWLASRGRQVVADIWLRAALRRAFKLTQLPIIVDNVQDVGGQPLPQIAGPVILLRTTDDKALSIQTSNTR